jgi:uncharacterized protein
MRTGATSLVLGLAMTAGCASALPLVPVLPHPGHQPAVESPSAAAAVAFSLETAPATTDGLAREFLVLLQAHQFAHAARRFDRTMATALPADRLEQVWTSIEQRLGPPIRTDIVEVVPRPPRTHVWFDCEFETAVWNVEVVIDGARRVSGLTLSPLPPPWSTPDYAAPSAFSERSIPIGNPPLQGTLAVPRDSVASAVVLVHGSGPQDEDGSLGPRGSGNKILKDLAWGLATRGVAVVRYPKRTWAFPEQFEGRPFTLDDEVTADACLAVQAVSNQLRIPTARVFVVGHSLGAALAPRIARTCPSLGGLVLLAGPSRSLDQVLFAQFQYLLLLAGKSHDEIADELQELLAGFGSALIPLGAPGEPLSFSGMRGPRSYWIDVAQYDPAGAVASAPRLPMLLLQGERDYQVRPAELQRWRQILRGQPDASFKLYPALDHRFISGEGISTPADYRRPGHVAPEVIDDITRWIAQRLPRG